MFLNNNLFKGGHFLINKTKQEETGIDVNKCLRIEVEVRDDKKEFDQELNSYMEAMRRQENLTMQCLQEMKEFREKTGKIVEFNRLPSGKKFRDSYKKLTEIGKNVSYCGRNANIWYNLGMRNENKLWKIREVWKSTILNRQKIMERTLSWEGTLEEYVQHYGLVIKYSNLPCYDTNGFFCGMVNNNVPEEINISDFFELEAWLIFED